MLVASQEVIDSLNESLNKLRKQNTTYRRHYNVYEKRVNHAAREHGFSLVKTDDGNLIFRNEHCVLVGCQETIHGYVFNDSVGLFFL